MVLPMTGGSIAQYFQAGNAVANLNNAVDG